MRHGDTRARRRFPRRAFDSSVFSEPPKEAMTRFGLRRQEPGGYALRRHKELRRAWQQRVFPRWTLYISVAVAVTVIAGAVLPDPWKTMLFVLGAGLVIGWWALKESFAPDHIERWQRGAWGEQMTAKELKPLLREGWIARHDIQSTYGNYDHIIVGHGVYLLETKYLTDSELTLEPGGLRVRRIDQPADDYLIDALSSTMERRGRRLWASLRSFTGSSVYVHTVVVLWGRFDEGVGHIRNVTYVQGDSLVAWLREQPQELSEELGAQTRMWLGDLRGK
jgi:hypothetical protein